MFYPLVSVIVPNYRHSKYLDQRIQSILAQTYQNFELIILDDCSPDDGASKSIIEKYHSNPHVKHVVYNTVNSGNTFLQWEKGFNLCTGDFVWIAESDDYSTTDFLDTLIARCDSHTSICYCISQLVNERGGLIDPVLSNLNKEVTRSGRDFIMQEMRTSNAIINASSAIFRLDYLKYIGKDYQNYVAAGDRLFWIKLAEQGNVTWVGKPMNFFRQHYNKVSPRKLIDGTTFREDYSIHHYLCNRGYVGFIADIEIRQLYLEKIVNVTFMSDDIKKSVYKLWVGNFLSSKIIDFLNTGIRIVKKLVYE